MSLENWTDCQPGDIHVQCGFDLCVRIAVREIVNSLLRKGKALAQPAFC